MEGKVRGGRCSHDTASACRASLVHSGRLLLHDSKLAPGRRRQFWGCETEGKGRAGKDRSTPFLDEGERHEWSSPALGRARRNTRVNVSSVTALSEEQLESLGGLQHPGGGWKPQSRVSCMVPAASRVCAKCRVLRLCPRLSRNARKGSRAGVRERSWGRCPLPAEDSLGRTVPVWCGAGKAKSTPPAPQHDIWPPVLVSWACASTPG